MEQKLNMSIHELDLSVRANNCLESAKIQTVRDLVQKTDAELLKVRSFGKTSLREVKRRLADMGLSLGMDLDALAAAASQPMEAYVADDDDEDDADDDAAEDGQADGSTEATADQQE
jgi:DNA-directed RNA polymerase subunit alpha